MFGLTCPTPERGSLSVQQMEEQEWLQASLMTAEWETHFNHKLHSYLQVATLSLLGWIPSALQHLEQSCSKCSWNTFLGTQRRWWSLGKASKDLPPLPRVKWCLTNLTKLLNPRLSAQHASSTSISARFPHGLHSILLPQLENYALDGWTAGW